MTKNTKSTALVNKKHQFHRSNVLLHDNFQSINAFPLLELHVTENISRDFFIANYQYINTHIHMHTYIFEHITMNIYIHTLNYIYIYIHINTYIHSLRWKHHTRHSTKFNKDTVHDD